MSVWVVSDCSYFHHCQYGPLWLASLNTWSISPGRDAELLWATVGAFCILTGTARSRSTNTITNSILTNSEKGIRCPSILANSSYNEFFKITLQICWVKNVNSVLFDLHFFNDLEAEPELVSMFIGHLQLLWGELFGTTTHFFLLGGLSFTSYL